MRRTNDLSNLVNTQNPIEVNNEVKYIMNLIYPDFDSERLDEDFSFVIDLFNGKNPGFKKSNTPYHDLEHTMCVYLAMARIIHGYQIANSHDPNMTLSKTGINLGIRSPLFHDIGMNQSIFEKNYSGASNTATHVKRSKAIMKDYFFDIEPLENIIFMERNLDPTNLSIDMKKIMYSTPEEKIVSQMVGTADLLGQMADSNYIDKLPYLFLEFKEAGIGEYNTILDIISGHEDFHKEMRVRLESYLGNMKKYMINHFRERHNIAMDLYEKCIDENLSYSNSICQDPRYFLKKLRKNEDFTERIKQLKDYGININMVKIFSH